MLTINLAAIQNNWLKLKALASSAQVAGVIKANAYGLGAEQVGRALYDISCREFFVATLDEALAARKFLPDDAKIYVLGGVRAGNEYECAEANLIPVLSSIEAIERWAMMNSSLDMPARSVIKINTGMTRLGVDIQPFKTFCADDRLLKVCNPVLLMSHLACADDPSHPLNHAQFKNFLSCAAQMRSVLPGIRLSLANSSGIFLGNKWQFDLVRPGAALYGIAPQPNTVNPMNPVVTLKLPIIQIRTLTEEASIGYGADVRLPKGSRIAIAAGGYADGVNRTLGKNPEGFLCGHQVQSIGRISMDVTIFDISKIQLPDEYLQQASVEVINEKLSLDYLSRKNNALGYEVLTSLGSRYKREYIVGPHNV